jgi:cell wall-associated NlpC family hydrolase
MTTGSDVVLAARSWLGVPFQWQQSNRFGCDCKGLIVGVARELGLPEAASLYAAIADYGRAVPVPLLLRGLAATFTRANEPRPGDVLLMTMGGSPCHLGFHAGDRVIHTYNNGPRRVITSRLAAIANVWPIHSAWRFPSLADG